MVLGFIITSRRHCSVAMRKMQELRPSFEIRLREQRNLKRTIRKVRRIQALPTVRTNTIYKRFPILPVGYIQHRHPMCKKKY